VLVSTHYLTEAERCDRVALMDAGRVLACDEPRELVRAAGERTLEDAFVTWIRAAGPPGPDGAREASP